ncbi:helix-turn-helix domain-containing protein [Oryzifoliimicrobium ureilyticus]|uniref:helix-turn-helix domain-containing protein n=1 Tax=Oryzifoliimicrobium ureilyticus TaxID=3113724 RepID=UPI0030767330
MIKAFQIRAARAMAGLSIEDLAATTGLSAQDLLMIEKEDQPRTASAAFESVRHALEQAGVGFFEVAEASFGGPGVFMKQKLGSSDGIRPENLDATNDD